MPDLGKFVDAKIAQAKAKQVICPECGGVDNGYGTCLCFNDEALCECGKPYAECWDDE